MAAPQVAGPLSSCPTGDGLSYDVHLKASICPNFPTGRPSGWGGEEAVLQNNSKTKGTNTLPLCYWNGETVI